MYADTLEILSQAGYRHGLIGPFASGVHKEGSTQDGLSGSRQFFGLDNHVRIAAADDNNFLGFHDDEF